MTISEFITKHNLVTTQAMIEDIINLKLSTYKRAFNAGMQQEKEVIRKILNQHLRTRNG